MYFGYYVKNRTFCFAENVKNRKMFTIKTRIIMNHPQNRRLANAESEISTKLIFKNNSWTICGHSC